MSLWGEAPQTHPKTIPIVGKNTQNAIALLFEWGRIDNSSFVLYNETVNAFDIVWRGVRNWLRRRRTFALDVDSYELLERMAERQQRTPQEVAAELLEQAAQAQERQSWVLTCWGQLSPRQQQITAYVCRGDSTRQIAAQLHIAPTTVKSHIEIVLRKFGVNSRAALRQHLAPWDLSEYL